MEPAVPITSTPRTSQATWKRALLPITAGLLTVALLVLAAYLFLNTASRNPEKAIRTFWSELRESQPAVSYQLLNETTRKKLTLNQWTEFKKQFTSLIPKSAVFDTQTQPLWAQDYEFILRYKSGTTSKAVRIPLNREGSYQLFVNPGRLIEVAPTAFIAKAKADPDLLNADPNYKTVIDKHINQLQLAHSLDARVEITKSTSFLKAFTATVAEKQEEIRQQAETFQRYLARSAAVERLHKFYEQGNYSEAVAAGQEALEFEDTADVHYTLAWVYRDGDDLPANIARAVDEARTAADMEPTNSEYVYGYATMLSKAESYEQAQYQYDRAVALATSNRDRSDERIADMFAYRGINLARLGRYYEAISSWRRALDFDYSNETANRNLDQLGER